MAEQNVNDMLNLINNEAVPNVAESLQIVQHGLADITQKEKDFKRDIETQLDLYKMAINEKISLAKLNIQEANSKLEDLFHRLEDEVETKGAEVETAISTRKKLSEEFISQSAVLEDHIRDDFDSKINELEYEAETRSNNIITGIASCNSNTEKKFDESISSTQDFKSTISDSLATLATTFDEGTASSIEKINTLTEHYKYNIERYHGEYKDMIEALIEQTDKDENDLAKALVLPQETVIDLNKTLDGSIGEVTDKLEAIEGMIEEMKPILDYINDLS